MSRDWTRRWGGREGGDTTHRDLFLQFEKSVRTISSELDIELSVRRLLVVPAHCMLCTEGKQRATRRGGGDDVIVYIVRTTAP